MVHRRSSSVDGKKTFGADKVKQIQRPFTVDIYAFGIFCLEILSDLVNDSEQAGTQVISLDDVKAAIATLDPEHQALILSCIDPDQTRRPSAVTLLSMSVFYEIPSLKVMCVHVLRQTFDHLDVRQLQDKAREEQHYMVTGESEEMSATPQHLEIEKIDTEIKNGMHLLSDSVALRKLSPVKNNKNPTVEGRAGEELSPVEDDKEHKRPSVESRLILCIKCQLNPSTVSGYLHLTLEFQMSDTMIRTLDTDIHEDENPEQLVDEIIGYGLLNKLDREMVVDSLVECLT